MSNLHKALALLSAIKWQSADNDNMEFTAKISCYQRDALRDVLAALAEPAPGGVPVARRYRYRYPGGAVSRWTYTQSPVEEQEATEDMVAVEVESLYRHPADRKGAPSVSGMKALESGEHLARAAENYMNAVNDDAEEADRTDTWNDLKRAIYEFRKRAFPPLASATGDQP